MVCGIGQLCFTVIAAEFARHRLPQVVAEDAFGRYKCTNRLIVGKRNMLFGSVRAAFGNHILQ